MDISILLILQEFREAAGAFLSDFFLKITYFGELNIILILMAGIYWCVNKKTGEYLMMGFSWNRILNGFLKITFCAYRPWIRDPRITPNETAIVTATGYSFPSGHSTNGGTFFGGLAISSKNKIFSFACWIMVVLIAFSRIFLGVHTPQDILVGAILSSLVMFAVYRVIDKYGENEKARLLMVGTPIVIDILLAIYASCKSYPLDYDATGKVLVEGAKMANDTFKNIGWSLAFFLGYFIEKKWIRFHDCETKTQAGARMIFGLLGFYIFNIIVCPFIKNTLGGTAGTIISCFVIVFYIVVIFPTLIVLYERGMRKLNKSKS